MLVSGKVVDFVVVGTAFALEMVIVVKVVIIEVVVLLVEALDLIVGMVV